MSARRPTAKLTDEEAWALKGDLNEAFSPGAPVQEKDLFAGRIPQLAALVDATQQRGRHAIVFGERGVGKTSLVNILSLVIHRPTRPVIAIKVNSDPHDTYSTLWRKIFRRLNKEHGGTLADDMPGEVTPDDVRIALECFRATDVPVIIFDEFDRMADESATLLMADTIKGLSDYSSSATIIIVGVAEDVADILSGHQSIARALLQIRMPRMSPDELGQIITSRYKKCGLTWDEEALWKMTFLARGLPYYAQLIGMHAGRAAVKRGFPQVIAADVEKGLKSAVLELDQSIKEAYFTAIRSQRGDHTLYASVLLACALAKNDELGAFQQAAVAQPLNRIVPGKDYKPATFAFHLNEFCDPARGKTLERFGEPRNYRYRFTDPMMQPFVIMKGLADGKIDDNTAETYVNKRQLELSTDWT